MASNPDVSDKGCVAYKVLLAQTSACVEQMEQDLSNVLGNAQSCGGVAIGAKIFQDIIGDFGKFVDFYAKVNNIAPGLCVSSRAVLQHMQSLPHNLQDHPHY